MGLKTYQGSTMAEALASVKRDLGRDAVILQTRTIRRGGLLGFGGREIVEITASGDVNVMPRPVRTGAAGRADGLARMFGQSHAAAAVVELPKPADAMKPGDGAMLKDELSAIREMVTDLVREQKTAKLPDLPEELFAAYLQLLESEVADEMARKIVQSLRSQLTGEETSDRRKVRDALVGCISKMIPTAGPVAIASTGRARVVALVGPTGVGKTTTIAKLAANYKLRENRRVGLVTIDTYRIAAVNQLATYAQIIDVPLKVVLTPAELKQTMAELAGQCDIILLDTAGRSPNDALKLNELRGFLAAAQPDETHLVLSSTCHPSAIKSAVQRFSPLGVNRIILTKLDEAVSFGIILQVVGQVNASLSYVTTGQDVPDDIEVGSAARLARWIVNRSLSDDAGGLNVTVADAASQAADGDHAHA
ncbi:MAG: flagellar biosynthesis protein FlhF [Phycisphaerae bacterium]|nr:flagellar biosynthesis protein FlhF [Phycisphaerae bacterium]